MSWGCAPNGGQAEPWTFDTGNEDDGEKECGSWWRGCDVLRSRLFATVSGQGEKTRKSLPWQTQMRICKCTWTKQRHSVDFWGNQVYPVAEAHYHICNRPSSILCQTSDHKPADRYLSSTNNTQHRFAAFSAHHNEHRIHTTLTVTPSCLSTIQLWRRNPFVLLQVCVLNTTSQSGRVQFCCTFSQYQKTKNFSSSENWSTYQDQYQTRFMLVPPFMTDRWVEVWYETKAKLGLRA